MFHANNVFLKAIALVAFALVPQAVLGVEGPFVETIKESLQHVEEMRKEARLILALTITVGVVGLVISVLQPVPKSIIKWVTVALGLVVGVLTLARNEMFDFDHKDLFRRASIAETHLLDMRDAERDFQVATNPQNKAEFDREIRLKARAIHALRRGLIEDRKKADDSNKKKDFGLLPVISEARAGGGEPNWLQRLPEDPFGMYFIGIADGRLVSDAKQSSFASALAEASDFLLAQLSSPNFRGDPKDLTRYLLEALEVRGTHSVYDRKRETYRFFTLVRLDREIGQRFTRLYARQKQVDVPPLFPSASSTGTPSSSYSAKRLAVYQLALDETKSKLTDDQYAAFSSARFLRQQGSCDRATSMLEDILSKNAASYFVWYNYALCLEDRPPSKTRMSSEKAYESAINLERQLPFRDASLYNSFGFFLYGKGRINEAIPLLRKVLDIDPAHPKARATLKAAEAKLKPR